MFRERESIQPLQESKMSTRVYTASAVCRVKNLLYSLVKLTQPQI